MRQEIKLFIGKKEVEFSSDPKILFNFKLTELENPTAFRNSWTKTITIPSTPKNDDVFNHFWNLERTSDYVDFNPTRKTNFELYVNNTLIQNGYCKLDSVKVSNRRTEYQVSLFGRLGDFFYNLSYYDGDNTDSKKTLASLNYADGDDFYYGDDPDLGFVINKDTVSEAWSAITGLGVVIPDDKWDVINFAPVYNGIPNDFDANKVLLNYRGINLGLFYRNWNDGGDWPSSTYHYQPIINGSKNYSGYSIGEAVEELTSDEVFDLRSYLNRPVVNVYRTIKACCNPANNGGYQVKLDNHFFNTNNPYYFGENAWVTLPMLRDLEIKGGQTAEITGATVTSRNRNLKDINFSSSSLSELNAVRLKMNIGLSTTYTGNELYSYFNATFSNPSRGNVKTYQQNEGLTIQLIARNANGVICAASDAHCFSSYQYFPHFGGNIWDGFWSEGSVYPQPKAYQYHQGKWMKKNNNWVFCDMYGNQVDVEFTFNTSSPISSLELLVQSNMSKSIDKKGVGIADTAEKHIDYSLVQMWTGSEIHSTANYSEGQVNTNYRKSADFTYNITEFYGEATDYESLFSNTYIPKEKLLATSYSPAEFLISYCKMFGLYFYTDPSELADDTTICPNGVIHIMDRDTFFNGEYVNLQDRIDRSKDITISPTMAGSKWYAFDLEHIEGEAEETYKSTFGHNYGRQLVNTNYNFDHNTTNLYESNVFKAGVMVREKDKYFAMPYAGNTPVYMLNGFKYTLYDISSADSETFVTHQLDVPTKVIEKTAINNLGLGDYDVMPKLQCHSKDNGATDGDGVLLFYKGYIQTPNNYWITDDVLEMQTLNEGNPCWLFTNNELDALGRKIAIKTNFLPQFTRDLILYGQQEGNIVHSWNFGHPRETYVPNTYTTEGDSIYDVSWKSYIGDMYSDNNKRLRVYVNLQGIPSNEWLRRWYWFNNSIWRLNEIIEWNVVDHSTTQCEFIKVMDVDNYSLDMISTQGIERLTLEQYTIPYTGGTINGVVYLQSGGHWYSADSSGVITGRNTGGQSFYSEGALRPYTGSGVNSPITVTIPASTSQTPITWHIMVEDDIDNVIDAYVVQDAPTSLSFVHTAATANITGETITEAFISNGVDPSTLAVSSNKTWARPSINGNNVVVVVDSNTSASRVATITLTGQAAGGTLTATLRVTQETGSLGVHPQSLEFDFYDEGVAKNITISVGTGVDWTISEQS